MANNVFPLTETGPHETLDNQTDNPPPTLEDLAEAERNVDLAGKEVDVAAARYEVLRRLTVGGPQGTDLAVARNNALRNLEYKARIYNDMCQILYEMDAALEVPKQKA